MFSRAILRSFPRNRSHLKRSPFSGWKKRARINKRVEVRTISGPVGNRLPRNERYEPIIPATIPSRADHKRRLFIFWVIMEAVAAGIISNAETRITPTTWREVITENANSIQRKYCKRSTGSPMERENP